MEIAFANVGDRIISRLQELGMKQADLCKKTGLSTTAMSHYCTGKHIPDTASLYKIATVLKTSMEWLITGKGLTSENTAPECPNQTESNLLSMFRLLSDYEQEDIFDLVHLKYKKHVEGKRAPTYSKSQINAADNKPA